MKYSISIYTEKGFVSVGIASPENIPGHLSVPQDTKITPGTFLTRLTVLDQTRVHIGNYFFLLTIHQFCILYYLKMINIGHPPPPPPPPKVINISVLNLNNLLVKRQIDNPSPGTVTRGN